MTITPEQARDLRSNVESHGYDFPFQLQPWGEQNQNGDREESILFDANGETILYGPPDSVGELLVSAPELAQTVIDQGKRIEELEAQNKALRNTDTSEWGY